jgi:GNAT superfamily N-acetyltransferase
MEGNQRNVQGTQVIHIRPATEDDADALWSMLEPAIRAAEVFALPADMTREAALAYWFAEGHSVFVADDQGVVTGSYYLQANQRGGGAHVCNCGYLTAAQSQGRGVARAMCEHSLQFGKTQGFRAMQFNFVVSSNAAAVHLWAQCGFRVLARLPGAFFHPRLGYVDALVMWQDL